MTIYKKISLSIVFLWFFTGGLLHFIEAEAFVNIMPSGLPWKYSAVYISGVFELIGAIGILFIGLRQWAGNGLFLLTLIVTPVNIHMWLHPELFPDAPPIVFSLRLIFQCVLLACIWWSTRTPDPVAHSTLTINKVNSL